MILWILPLAGITEWACGRYNRYRMLSGEGRFETCPYAYQGRHPGMERTCCVCGEELMEEDFFHCQVCHGAFPLAQSGDRGRECGGLRVAEG